MKKILSSIFNAYRKYRTFTKQSKTYKAVKYSLVTVFAGYGLILVFPQVLFAHEVSYKNFNFYSRQPLDESVYKVLDSAEARLEKSPLYDKNLTKKVFVSDTFSFYTFLNPKARGSFANTMPLIGNVTVNKVDIADDTVFRHAETDNQRSLSGVIAHEVTHTLIENKFGWANSLKTPSWKKEGYCEYVAGETTIGFAEGARRWKENPNDDSKYLYFKYHQIVRYLLDDEKISIEELFNRDFDEKELAGKVFVKISK